MNKLYTLLLVLSLSCLVGCSNDSNYLEVAEVQLSHDFTAKGGTKFLTVNTDLEYVVKTDADWIYTEIYKGVTNNLRITANENTLAVKRSADIILESTGVQPITIKVNQANSEPFINAYPNEVTLSSGKVDIEIEVNANTDFTITLPKWISNSEDNTPIIGTKKYHFKADKLFGEERRGEIIMKNSEGTITKTISVVQTEEIVPIFEDDFSYTENKGYAWFVLGSTGTADVTFDKNSEGMNKGWTSTIHTGKNEAGLPQVKLCDGFISAPFYAKRPSNMVTPKLKELNGTDKVKVTFKACMYDGGTDKSAPDAANELHVYLIGPGTCSVDKFDITQYGRNWLEHKAYDENVTRDVWQKKENVEYEFTITGVTTETQIAFHFGPLWPENSQYTANHPDLVSANINCRMGFDDVVVMPIYE
ncbi:BACON domain-containing protein [Bacteroides ovatus]|uniref:BACON domain-containing protein n=1 Tax=Bacteroides ovatus TaxID=28116 RepID=UPI0012AC1E5A|nr:BACON domain-containing carbohydrate-binding protein [Bacteroides ovatus]